MFSCNSYKPFLKQEILERRCLHGHLDRHQSSAFQQRRTESSYLQFIRKVLTVWVVVWAAVCWRAQGERVDMISRVVDVHSGTSDVYNARNMSTFALFPKCQAEICVLASRAADGDHHSDSLDLVKLVSNSCLSHANYCYFNIIVNEYDSLKKCLNFSRCLTKSLPLPKIKCRTHGPISGQKVWNNQDSLESPTFETNSHALPGTRVRQTKRRKKKFRNTNYFRALLTSTHIYSSFSFPHSTQLHTSMSLPRANSPGGDLLRSYDAATNLAEQLDKKGMHAKYTHSTQTAARYDGIICYKNVHIECRCVGTAKPAILTAFSKFCLASTPTNPTSNVLHQDVSNSIAQQIKCIAADMVDIHRIRQPNYAYWTAAPTFNHSAITGLAPRAAAQGKRSIGAHDILIEVKYGAEPILSLPRHRNYTVTRPAVKATIQNSLDAWSARPGSAAVTQGNKSEETRSMGEFTATVATFAFDMNDEEVSTTFMVFPCHEDYYYALTCAEHYNLSNWCNASDATCYVNPFMPVSNSFTHISCHQVLSHTLTPAELYDTLKSCIAPDPTRYVNSHTLTTTSIHGCLCKSRSTVHHCIHTHPPKVSHCQYMFTSILCSLNAYIRTCLDTNQLYVFSATTGMFVLHHDHNTHHNTKVCTCSSDEDLHEGACNRRKHEAQSHNMLSCLTLKSVLHGAQNHAWMNTCARLQFFHAQGALARRCPALDVLVLPRGETNPILRTPVLSELRRRDTAKMPVYMSVKHFNSTGIETILHPSLKDLSGSQLHTEKAKALTSFTAQALALQALGKPISQLSPEETYARTTALQHMMADPLLQATDFRISPDAHEVYNLYGETSSTCTIIKEQSPMVIGDDTKGAVVLNRAERLQGTGCHLTRFTGFGTASLLTHMSISELLKAVSTQIAELCTTYKPFLKPPSNSHADVCIDMVPKAGTWNGGIMYVDGSSGDITYGNGTRSVVVPVPSADLTNCNEVLAAAMLEEVCLSPAGNLPLCATSQGFRNANFRDGGSYAMCIDWLDTLVPTVLPFSMILKDQIMMLKRIPDRSTAFKLQVGGSHVHLAVRTGSAPADNRSQQPTPTNSGGSQRGGRNSRPPAGPNRHHAAQSNSSRPQQSQPQQSDKWILCDTPRRCMEAIAFKHGVNPTNLPDVQLLGRVRDIVHQVIWCTNRQEQQAYVPQEGALDQDAASLLLEGVDIDQVLAQPQHTTPATSHVSVGSHGGGNSGQAGNEAQSEILRLQSMLQAATSQLQQRDEAIGNLTDANTRLKMANKRKHSQHQAGQSQVQLALQNVGDAREATSPLTIGPTITQEITRQEGDDQQHSGLVNLAVTNTGGVHVTLAAGDSALHPGSMATAQPTQPSCTDDGLVSETIGWCATHVHQCPSGASVLSRLMTSVGCHPDVTYLPVDVTLPYELTCMPPCIMNRRANITKHELTQLVHCIGSDVAPSRLFCSNPGEPSGMQMASRLESGCSQIGMSNPHYTGQEHMMVSTCALHWHDSSPVRTLNSDHTFDHTHHTWYKITYNRAMCYTLDYCIYTSLESPANIALTTPLVLTPNVVSTTTTISLGNVLCLVGCSRWHARLETTHQVSHMGSQHEKEAVNPMGARAHKTYALWPVVLLYRYESPGSHAHALSSCRWATSANPYTVPNKGHIRLCTVFVESGISSARLSLSYRYCRMYHLILNGAGLVTHWHHRLSYIRCQRPLSSVFVFIARFATRQAPRVIHVARWQAKCLWVKKTCTRTTLLGIWRQRSHVVVDCRHDTLAQLLTHIVMSTLEGRLRYYVDRARSLHALLRSSVEIAWWVPCTRNNPVPDLSHCPDQPGGAGCVADNSTPDFHFEPQERAHCQVHAANMLFGREVVTAADLFNVCRGLEQGGADNGVLHFYDPVDGRFSDDVLNMHLQSTLSCTLIQIGPPQQGDMSMQHIVRALSRSAHGHNTTALMIRTASHSAVVKYHPLSGWWLLDSQESGPIRLRDTPSRPPAVLTHSFSMHAMQACDQRGEMQLTGLHIATPYWQPQRGQFCLIHAVNALLGSASVIPEEVISYFHSVRARYEIIHQMCTGNPRDVTVCWDSLYTPNGNFTIPCLNKYIAHQRVFGSSLVLRCALPHQNLSLAAVRSCIKSSSWHQGAVLVSRDKGYAHAVAVVCMQEELWLVDSEAAGPVLLPRDGVTQLQGTLYTLHPLEECDQESCWKLWCPDDASPSLYYNNHTSGRIPPGVDGSEAGKANTEQHKAKTQRINTCAPSYQGHASNTIGVISKPQKVRQRTCPQSQTRSIIDFLKQKDTACRPNGNGKSPYPRPGTGDEPDMCPSAAPTNAPLYASRDSSTFKVVTLNVRGLRTSAPTVEAALSGLAAHVYVLTEHKLVASHTKTHSVCKRLEKEMGFHVVNSCSPPSDDTSHGRRGVMILVSKVFAVADVVAVPAHLAGCIAHVTLEDGTRYNPCHVIGCYLPCDDTSARVLAYEYIEKVCCLCRQNNHTLIVAGDMNAVLFAEDRKSGNLSTNDSRYSEFVRTCGLVHPRELGPRSHTYHTRQPQGASSRIDDILWLSSSLTRGVTTSVSTEPVGDLDHDALCVDFHGCNLPCPGQPAQSHALNRKLITPILKEELMLARARIQGRLGLDMARLESRLRQLETTAMAAMPGSHNADACLTAKGALIAAGIDIDSLADNIMTLLTSAHGVMLETCRTRICHGGRWHAKRVAMRRLSKALRDYAALRWLHRRAYNAGCMNFVRNILQDPRYCKHAQQPSARLLLTSAPETDQPDAVRQHLDSFLRAAKAAYKSALDDACADRCRAARKRFDLAFRRNRKSLHKSIFSNQCEDRLQGMFHPNTAVLHKDATGITDCFRAHLASIMEAPSSPCDTITRAGHNPPWEQLNAPDRMVMQTPGQAACVSATLVDRIREGALFERAIRCLSNGKATGPDGIPNELLKYMPIQWQRALRHFFVLCWIMGTTPTNFKQSTTVMLYKKGPTDQPRNYRPIGLNQTIYKLWTKVIQYVLQEYCESHNVLHAGQEGCLPGKSTARQAQNLVNAIEDAAVSKQDLLVLYIDFSSAFTSVDHACLLQTMTHLGFPGDAVRVIENLYTGANTRVVHADCTSRPIHIRRGTIQGDSLSPFLFLVYIDPLLKWLQNGGRGYSFGCLSSLPKPDRLRYRMAGQAYVDDLAITTNNIEDMGVQVKKLSMWSAYAHVDVNVDKCAATGALHRTVPSGDIQVMAAKLVSLFACIFIAGQRVPVLPPDQPYKYLGWLVTMTLHWHYQYQQSLETIRAYGMRIRDSMARMGQVVDLVNSKIRPAVTYHLSLAPYTVAQVEQLDRALANTVRAACRLPRGFAQAGIMLPRDKGGMGLRPLMSDYVQSTTSALVHRLNDQGPLGVVTRGLMKAQMQKWGRSPLEHVKLAWHQSTALRQARIMITSGLTFNQDVASKLGVPARAGAWDQWLVACGADAEKKHGWAARVSDHHLRRLFDLGITTPFQLLDGTGRNLIDCTSLRNRFGAKQTHCRALTAITLALHAGKGPLQKAAVATFKSLPSSLPASFRSLPDELSVKGHDPQTRITQETFNLLSSYQLTDPSLHSRHKRPPAMVQQPTRAFAHNAPRKALWDSSAYEDARVNPTGHEGLPTESKLEQLLLPQSQLQSVDADAHRTIHDAYAWCIAGIVGGPIRETHARRAWSRAHRSWSLSPVHTISYVIQWKPMLMFREHWLAYTRDVGRQGDHRADADTVVDVGRAFDQPVVEIHFKPSTQLQSILQQQPEWQALLAAYTTKQASHPAPVPAPSARDSCLEPMQRQGCWITAPSDQDKRIKLGTFVHIDASPCDPMRDLAETPLVWCIQTGRLQDSKILGTEVASIYDAQGRWSGSLSQKRITWLRHCWDTCPAKAARPPACSLLTEGDHELFAQHVAQFVCRWDTQLTHSRRLFDGLDPHVDAQFPALDHIIPYECAVVRCSNPALAPVGYQGFTSAYTFDDHFGRCGTDFHAVWSGVTWCAPPVADLELQHKAVRFAVASAMVSPQRVPVLVALIVSKATRQALASHPTLDTRWIEDLGAVTCADTTRYALIVGNQAGWSLRRDSPSRVPPSNPVPTPAYAPRCFQAARVPVTVDATPLRQAWSFTHSHVYPCPFPTGLHTARNTIMYTDGSCIKKGQSQLVGAAFVVHRMGSTFPFGVRPNGQGDTHTINRSELSAIHQALVWAVDNTPPNDSIVIYTDSACSLSAIARVARSHDLPYYHVHFSLLCGIRETLLKLCSNGVHINLRKVKSHTGIPGNDEADRAAKAVALGDTSGMVVCAETASNEGRDAIFWPLTKRNGVNVSVPDLDKGVHSACNSHIVDNHGGSYDSVYAKAWRAIQETIDTNCACVWNHAGVSWNVLKTTVKYRFGCLWTAKRASMFGVPYFGQSVKRNEHGNACCPLCGLEDSGTHMMGGCTHPTMHKLYIARHNRAVNYIRDALSKGSLAGSVMFMDACQQAALPTGVSGTGTSMKRLVEKAPDRCPADLVPRISKPDIVVLQGVTEAAWKNVCADGTLNLPRGTTLSLFEIGYCQDTIAMGKRQDKHKQHSELVATLQQLGYQIDYPETHCIMLGHGGTVFNNLHNLLARLGVPPASIKHVTIKLAINAVESAHAILTQRRIIEASKRGETRVCSKKQKKEMG